MTITPKTIIHHCLIGLKVKIVNSSNLQYLNMVGTIIDETKNTLTIEVSGKEKQIPKKDCVFQFYLSENHAVEVNGSLIRGRPEERVKKRITYKWNK